MLINQHRGSKPQKTPFKLILSHNKLQVVLKTEYAFGLEYKSVGWDRVFNLRVAPLFTPTLQHIHSYGKKPNAWPTEHKPIKVKPTFS